MKNICLPFLLLFFSYQVLGQDTIDVDLPQPLIIGVTETPPFIMIEDGQFSGLGIFSWEMVHEELEVDFQYKVYPSLDSLLSAVQQGEVDFSINPITVTDKRMRVMDFSQPYFIAHTAIAKKDDSNIWKYIANILSWKFISAILILVGVIFIFGLLVWLFERKANKEQFGEGPRGIFQGFWWSAVTMTTVGYGDKSPTTFGGRLVGLIWMFMAIIMISSLTAGIASSLTVQNMNDQINNINDLENFDVVTIRSSSAEELLDQYGVNATAVPTMEEGFEKIRSNEEALFVYDQPILNYYITENDLKDDFEILPKMLKKDYYSYSFPKGSNVVEVINPVLVATLKTIKWNNLIKEYK